MIKSSQHQASVKYLRNPYAQILTNISNTKIIVNTLSSTLSAALRMARSGSSMFTSSAALVNTCQCQINYDRHFGFAVIVIIIIIIIIITLGRYVPEGV